MFHWYNSYILGLSVAVVLLFSFATKLGILLFIALLMTLLLESPKNFFQKKVSSGVASLLSLLLFIGAIAILAGWIVKSMLPSFKQFVQHAPLLLTSENLSAILIRLSLPPEINDYTYSLISNAGEFAVEAMKKSLLPAMQAMSGIVEMVGIPFIVFYFLKDGRKLRQLLVAVVPEAEQEKILTFYHNVGLVLSGYIKGQLTVCFISGITVLLFFLLTGLPYAPVFAALSAIGEFIPVIGPLTASVLAISLAVNISFAKGVNAIVFFAVMFKLNHNIVYPKLVGKAIYIHPVVIMIGLLLFGHLFGIVGMMLAVPVMGILRVILISTIPALKSKECQRVQPLPELPLVRIKK